MKEKNNENQKPKRRRIPALYQLADYYGDCYHTFLKKVKTILVETWSPEKNRRKLTFKEFLTLQDHLGPYDPEKYPIK